MQSLRSFGDQDFFKYDRYADADTFIDSLGWFGFIALLLQIHAYDQPTIVRPAWRDPRPWFEAAAPVLLPGRTSGEGGKGATSGKAYKTFSHNEYGVITKEKDIKNVPLPIAEHQLLTL